MAIEKIWLEESWKLHFTMDSGEEGFVNHHGNVYVNGVRRKDWAKLKGLRRAFGEVQDLVFRGSVNIEEMLNEVLDERLADEEGEDA